MLALRYLLTSRMVPKNSPVDRTLTKQPGTVQTGGEMSS